MARLLITGSSGLVGRALTRALTARGHTPVGFDRVEGPDVRDLAAVRAAVRPVDGVVHLAAVSRVLWGEQDPEACLATNVGGTRHVLQAAAEAPARPFVLLASSREVYGHPEALPVAEDAPLRPVNVYGRSKVEGERLVQAARDAGHPAAVVRLSNVYGDPVDHLDRVVPAFVRGALAGETLRVDGSGHTFDFTWLPDVVDGLCRLVERLLDRERPEPVHLVSGEATTLGALAALAIAAAGRGAVREAPPRDFDVARFVGDPRRAARLLGWRATVGIGEGVSRLSAALRVR